MRLGIIISIVIVALLTGLFFVLSGSSPDEPTKATAPAKLKEFKLKAGLPAMWEVTSSDTPSGPLYDKLLSLVQGNKRYSDDNVPDMLVETMVGQLIAASEAGQPATGFLDDKIPMKPGAEPTFGGALEVINDLSQKHASKLKERGEPGRAVRILRASWALGQRCFEQSRRLYSRRTGLDLMRGAANGLSDLTEQDSALTDQLAQWTPELTKANELWQPKIEQIINNLRPQIGDLINMAGHEEDVSFRTEAVLQLGLKKFAPGGKKGNKDAIENLIKKLQDDEEPLISKAAKAAAAVQKEDIGKMR